MRLPDKTCTIEEAIARIPDGAVVMIGGFGVPGTPFALIRELVRHGATQPHHHQERRQRTRHRASTGCWPAVTVARLVTTHIGLNARAIAMLNAGDLVVEFNAQGILAERVRAGGAGLAAILTDIGLDTDLALGKQRVEIDGKTMLVETALRADAALIHADRADVFGNLGYVATARNFNPLMAMAGDLVIAEAESVLPLGAIAADAVQTPGPFVDHVVGLPELSEEYAVVRR